MSERLKAEDFEKKKNDAVTFSDEESTFTATIKLVDRLKQHHEQGTPPFSVVFCADHSEAHPQKIYTMRHADMGEHAIFLVPIGPDESGMCYEAVFA